MNIIKSNFRKYGLSLFVCLVFLFLYMPIAILVTFSFNSASFPSPWTGFSLKWYSELFNSPDIWRAFYVSVAVAFSAMTLSLSVAIALVYYKLMGGKADKLLILFYGNVVMPEIILAVSMLAFFTFFSIPLGFATLIVAHTILGLGLVVPIIYGRYLLMDRRIIESSLDLGATMVQTFFRIVLPSLYPALIASGLLVFILSFDDFVLSFFCASNDYQTLSLYIYSMIRAGVSPVVNALSTLLLFISSFLVLIFCSFNFRTKIF